VFLILQQGEAAGWRAVKNMDLTHPLERLPHHYHNIEQEANKDTQPLQKAEVAVCTTSEL
jgi:hypothetical protein